MSQATTAGSGSERRRIEFKIERAFLSASLRSEVLIQPKGRALAARRWEGLDKDEQQEFLEMYQQASTASWFEEGPAAGETNAAATPRDPQDKEFFTAFWARSPKQVIEGLAQLDPAAAARDPKETVRFDFRVDASGQEVTLEDRLANLTLLKLSNL